MESASERILATVLQETYSVPFSVHIAETSQGLGISARPSPDQSELLSVEATVTQGVRLRVEAIPERYCRPLIDTMAEADEGKRATCRRCLSEIDEKARNLTFSVGGRDLLRTDVEDWPSSWETFEYRFVVFPLDEHATSEGLLEDVFGWVVRAFGPVFALLNVKAEGETRGYKEGSVQKALSNRYERDPRNRRLCLEAHGCRCAVCGVDLGGVYGPLGSGFIHVHHVIPVSQLGSDYVIDPVRDLVPVCPNCHAMLHRTDPPLMPNELRAILERRRG